MAIRRFWRSLENGWRFCEAFGDPERLTSANLSLDFDRDLCDGSGDIDLSATTGPGDIDLSATTEPAEPRGLAIADDEAA